MCESWFTFTWLTIISTKWNPSYTISYPSRLFSRVAELPAVDLFVTTADPVLEPPIITVNTVLSLLALDYPSNKLACYVSDDGCSPFNLYALVEASKFAKIWIPFCKKYNVKTRAPFRYFSDSSNNNNNIINGPEEFKQEWLAVKDGYEQLCSKIKKATTKSIMLDQEFHVFSTTQQNNHPTIIKVIWENKEGVSDGMPHLIYVSREKNPIHPHHYKAGAMNVLTRVTGLMTNAPYILNVDCDMHVNNPEIVQHALCILMDPKGQKEVAFAQCPQLFYDGLKDDPFGNQLVSIFVYIGGGVSGIQGIFYVGTNCVHRRKVIYGLSPHHHIQNGNNNLGKSSKKDIIFGSSEEFVESAAQALKGKTFTQNTNLCNSLEAAKEVAASGYEHGTDWGKQVGWMYGSSAEDVLTGLKIHSKGWRSESCGSDPIAFMGCTAQDSIVQVGQYQRWASGLLEVFLGKNCPILCTLFGKLQFRQCLAYIWLTTWALRSVPETCYALLPAYCIISNSHFLPKDLGMLIPAVLFVTYHISTLLEYLKTGLSMRSWWNNQRMFRITAMNPWMFAFVATLLKKLRISDYGFLVTKKEQPSSSDEGSDKSNANDGGRFIFNKSLVFVPGTTILLVQLTALLINFFGWQPKARSGGHGSGFGELLCSAYVVLVYLPFLKGLFGKGKYGIPLSTICKSMALALFFVHLSMYIV
ncbi:hypothetical protein PIB30_030369 [Stylosanthes scabra]|uniref:Cellulose synthase-like protein H1 n=1 Tax=Stylosanthes scabra TaxID=79078 RepID=A0ABU6WDM2_9FABA|nr:hypothetical protein [Stylosanthes scabra]